ncbi:DUF952 domain-containing protein [Hymenobacter oligotrophus]|uniref:DUF952 domain-containing protein n=1 Tax=Hymenobacter oligotrophus TaxID=2319843 RepID=A0A3B7QXF8_9BACT|nr:DUF952 domain-containing protein [Hymenobacter oligotrophus]AYA35923.1 DUF952 domain-containing protein [Hymenobacter oligotrophus]
MMLYRVAELPDWQRAQQTGFFASADLQAEGFIHTSERHQLLDTANRYYPGRTDIVLLELDEATLGAAGVPVKREWAESRGQFFAHVFGAIPLGAVRRTLPFAPAPDGTFALPAELT